MAAAFTVFPAPAGMSPKHENSYQPIPSFPRTCGDEPARLAALPAAPLFSPHLRG